MRIAFVCDTPFQTLNATNLYWCKYRGQEGVSADLYIVDQFRNARSICDNIRDLGIFDNVYFLRREENRFMPKGLKRSVRVAYSYFNPAHAVRNQFDGELPRDKYDMVYAAIMRCITASILKLNPNAEFNMFDDGVGSYSGDLIANGGGTAYKLFSKLTGLGANTARAKRIFVNNAPMCHSTCADEICQMPAFTHEFLEAAYKIFGFEQQDEALSGVIMMSEPGDTVDYRIVMDNMAAVMRPWKDIVLVRMHPRDTCFERYDGYRLDTKGEMWELKIAQMDTDNLLLVGTYSTAQLTPKMLFNKEPWLLFTYRMYYGIHHPSALESTERFAMQIRDSYSDKDRVMIPRDEQELKQCMERFLSR